METRTRRLSAALLSGAALTVYSCGGGGGGGAGGGAAPGNVPRFAYVTNFFDYTVSIYAVNPATGQLRHSGYVNTLYNPRSVGAHPSGKFLYVANQYPGDVSAFAIDPANGSLSEIDQNGAAGTHVAAGANSHSVTVDPSGRFAYVANDGGGVSAFTIDPVSGALAKIPCSAPSTCTGDNFGGPNSQEITIDPSGKFAYVANFSGGVSAYSIGAGGALVAINCGAGSPACIGTDFTAGTGAFFVSIHPSGKFAYVANFQSNDVSAFAVGASGGLVRIDCGTGPACNGPSPSGFKAGTNPVAVAVDPSGRFVYVANNAGGVSSYAIDAASGALKEIAGSPFPTGAEPFAIRIDPTGKFAYVVNRSSGDISIYAIDPASGSLSDAGAVRGRFGPSELAMTQGTSEVSYTPTFVYATNAGSNNGNDISAFPVGASGGLGASTSFAAHSGSAALAIDPRARFLYAAAGIFAGVTSLRIDGPTGALASVGVPAAFTAVSVAADPSGSFVYMAGNSQNVGAFRVSPLTGALSVINTATLTANLAPLAAAVDPSGRFVYAADLGGILSIYAIDSFTGNLSGVGTVNLGAMSLAAAIAPEPSGKFVYASNGEKISAYAIDALTGALTEINQGGPGTPKLSSDGGAFSMAVHPSGKFAYAANSSGNSISTYQITSAGALSKAGVPLAVPAGTQTPRWITLDLSGRFAYVALGSDHMVAYSVDSVTGALTALGAPATAGPGVAALAVAGTIQ